MQSLHLSSLEYDKYVHKRALYMPIVLLQTWFHVYPQRFWLTFSQFNQFAIGFACWMKELIILS